MKRNKFHKFSVIFTNTRSVLPKRDLLHSFIADNESDIVILTETWLSPNVDNEEVLPPPMGYNVFRRDRLFRKGGGVIIAVKDNIPSFLFKTDPILELLWVCVHSQYSKFFIGVCYRAPDSGPSFTDNLYNAVFELHNQFPKSAVFLFGDFNFPSINWQSLTVPTSGTTNDSCRFLDLCLTFNLTQVINEPTRLDNILDLLLTNTPD